LHFPESGKILRGGQTTRDISIEVEEEKKKNAGSFSMTNERAVGGSAVRGQGAIGRGTVKGRNKSAKRIKHGGPAIPVE